MASVHKQVLPATVQAEDHGPFEPSPEMAVAIFDMISGNDGFLLYTFSRSLKKKPLKS